MMQYFSKETFQVDPQKIVCPNQQKVSLLCATKNCSKYALVCSKQQCQCNSQNQHGSCLFVLSSKLIKSLQAKRGAIPTEMQKAFDAIDNMYLDAIEALSEDRQKMNIMRNNYGLSQEEGKVLTYLYDKNQEKLVGDLVYRVKQIQLGNNGNLQDVTKESVEFFWNRQKKHFNTLLAKMRNVIHENKLVIQIQSLRQEIAQNFDDKVCAKAIKTYYKIKKNTSSLIFGQFNKRIRLWWQNIKNDKNDINSYLWTLIPEINSVIQDLIDFEKSTMGDPNAFMKKIGVPQDYTAAQAERKFDGLIKWEQINIFTNKTMQNSLGDTLLIYKQDANTFIQSIKRFWCENGEELIEKIFMSVHRNGKSLGKKLRKHLIHPQHSAILLVSILSQGEKVDLANILLNIQIIIQSNAFRNEIIEIDRMLDNLVKKVWYDDEEGE